jgi:hypothetical protein
MIVYSGPTAQDRDLGIFRSPYICGVDLVVNWDQVQPNGSNQNWGPKTNDSVSPEIHAWEHALGDTSSAVVRTVNLIVVGASETKLSATPTWVTTNTNQSSVLCGGTQTPVMWDTPYQNGWESFIQKTLVHFNGAPDIGYIRFGLGTGGEGIIDGADGACQADWATYGYPSKFANYVNGNPNSYGSECPDGSGSAGLLGYIASQRGELTSPPDVQIALNTDNVPCESAVAAQAAAQHLGFGNQALSMTSYTNNCSTSPPTNWCALFGQFKGQAPLHLQTYQETCVPPNPNFDQPGDLNVLLGDAEATHAQMLELYQQDWEAAYTKGSTCYGTYRGYLQEYAQSYFGEAP